MRDIMKVSDIVRYYCFNKNCKSSIFFSDTCIVTEILLTDTAGDEVFCQDCYKEMVSKHDLNIKIQLSQLLSEERLYKSLIIDDDLAYHSYANALFKNSSTFNELKHYTDGTVAINYLDENKGKAHIMPTLFLLM